MGCSMEYKIRRKFIRWDLKHEVNLKIGAGEPTSCQVHNISLKGVEVTLARELAQDRSNKLQLYFDDGHPVSAEGWVMWHRRVDGLNVYGLYFTRISDTDKEKLYEFVVRHCRQQVYDNMYRETLDDTWGQESMPDRRNFERFPVSLPLVYADPVTRKKGCAQTSDLSANGLGLVVNEPLEPAVPLDVEIRLVDQAQFVCLKAMVVWSMGAESEQYRAGLKLDRMQFMELGRLLRSRCSA